MSRPTSLVLALVIAVALTPGCAVIDGLGGEDDEGGFVSPPDAQVAGFSDANLGPRDGGFGGDGGVTSYEIRFMPPLTDACSPGFTVSQIPFAVTPDGRFDVSVGPIRMEGVADPATIMGLITCQSGGMPYADLNGEPNPSGYSGTYQVVPLDVNGQIDVVRF